MMSFRPANDHTYIAQLLGRMVRTPMQMSIKVDETLNDVHLYLPQFNESTVYEVVEALRSSEGANIPTDVEAEQIGTNTYDTLTLRPTYEKPARKQGQKVSSDPNQISLDFDNPGAISTPNVNPVNPATFEPAVSVNIPSVNPNQNDTTTATTFAPPSNEDVSPVTPDINDVEGTREDLPDIDSEAVVKTINDAGLLTYNVRRVHIANYLKSVFSLARFLTQTRIDFGALENVISDIINLIHTHIEDLKKTGFYDTLVDQVLQFKLSTQIFDVFGRTVDNNEVHDFYSTTDTDIERQFRLAEARLGNEGVGNAYCSRYYEINDALTNRINVIIFAADARCMDSLNAYAKDKFHELNDENRRRTVGLPERFKKKYDDIVSDGDIVSKHNFRLPETIRVPREAEGVAYNNHLFVDDSGSAVISLNGWEQKVIEEEQSQEEFVCWLRNPSRGSWALCIPYEIDSEMRPTYPDFLVIRKDGPAYVVDVLEPHDPTRIDNLGKAKGFAEYARQNPGVGRIELIKMKKDSVGKERPFRLDMSRSIVRDKVSHCANSEELNHIFEEFGYFM